MKVYAARSGFQALFSFLGHFGVQIFIFLSAYGLTKKFLEDKPRYWPYILKRFLNIYPSFILAILLWALVVGGWRFGLFGPFEILSDNSESLLLKLSLLSNLFPNEALLPVGPWWFIGFIFQFYFTFPLLFRLYQHWGNGFLIGLSALGLIINIALNGEIGKVSLYVNLIGHLPELALGMYLVKHDNYVIKNPKIAIFLVFIIFILGNMNQALWHLNHIAFLILLLAGLNNLLPRIKQQHLGKKALLFLGAISMPLFLVNGFLRRPFISIAEKFDKALMTIVAGLLFLVTSIIIAFALTKIEKYLMSKLLPKNNKKITRVN